MSDVFYKQTWILMDDNPYSLLHGESFTEVVNLNANFLARESLPSTASCDSYPQTREASCNWTQRSCDLRRPLKLEETRIWVKEAPLNLHSHASSAVPQHNYVVSFKAFVCLQNALKRQLITWLLCFQIRFFFPSVPWDPASSYGPFFDLLNISAMPSWPSYLDPQKSRGFQCASYAGRIPSLNV